MTFKRVAVYCGSSTGNDPKFQRSAEELADYFVDNDITMVNGGGSIGIMGIMSDRMLKRGGDCVGVIPLNLKARELAHYKMTELITTPGMHERKRYILDTCDAFVALPGGYGTLDELFECITWRQLNLHNRPVGLLNVSGYFDPILNMVTQMKSAGFVNQQSNDLLLSADSVEGLMNELVKDAPVMQNKWLS